jgi:double-stranded uracil-DNA glycosylase
MQGLNDGASQRAEPRVDGPQSAPMSTIRSFAPLTSPDARVLILGSMPGIASLTAAQYYAHPRNMFWPIMGELFDAHPALPYSERTQALRRHGVALWDVLDSCRRQGSLDTAIVDARANDLAGFLRDHPRLTHVFFNGAKAEQLFRRAILPVLTVAAPRLVRLPSTSPAHASLPRAAKLAAWQVVRDAAIEPIAAGR